MTFFWTRGDGRSGGWERAQGGQIGTFTTGGLIDVVRIAVERIEMQLRLFCAYYLEEIVPHGLTKEGKKRMSAS
jgi:hypothetical protein